MKWVLSPGDSIREAGKKMLARQSYKLRANTEGAVLDLDAEYVHDLRVATRRARFALKMLRSFLRRRDGEDLRSRLNALANDLGEVRDLDVFLARLESMLERAHAPKQQRVVIRKAIQDRRGPALERLQEKLGSPSYGELLERLDQAVSLFENGGADAPLTSLAPEALRKALKRVTKHASGGAEQLPAEELHALRIDFKGLRYTCEFFSEVYPGTMDELIDQFVQFQDVLGLFNDAQVAMERLQELAALLEREQTNPRNLLLTLGALVQLHRDRAEEQRREFSRIWEKFSKRAKRLRRLISAMSRNTSRGVGHERREAT